MGLAIAVSFACLGLGRGLQPVIADVELRSPARPPRDVTPETEAAIKRGLAFLVSRQSADGAWREQGRGGYGTYPVAMTALSGMALVASGSTPQEGPYAPNINRAVSYILGSAQNSGLICRAGEEETRSMYAHGFSMLFLSQVLGMEGDADRLAEVRNVLRKAVELTGRAQSDLGGWIYTPDSGGDEGSVTITQVQGLRSCKDSGVAVPRRVIDNAMKYLDMSIQPDGGIAYRVGMQGSRAPITAAAVACWYNAGLYNDPRAVRALRYCKENIGNGGQQRGVWGHYFYAHLYMSQIMYLSGQKNWEDYYPSIRDRLLSTQSDDGSWEGDGVGRVYGTAVALTILQLPYNYLPIYQR